MRICKSCLNAKLLRSIEDEQLDLPQMLSGFSAKGNAMALPRWVLVISFAAGTESGPMRRGMELVLAQAMMGGKPGVANNWGKPLG